MPGPLTFHTLRDDQFRSIAAGYGAEDALAELRSSQLSKRLLLLHWIRDLVDDDGAAVITAVGQDRPDVFREVIAQPFVDVWAGEHGRALEGGARSDPHAIAYLAGLAATVAVRAGIEAELPIATQPGQIVLPGLGLAYGLGTGPARVRCAAGRVTVAGPDRTVTATVEDRADRPHWCPYRSIVLGPAAGTPAVIIDDLDPYRARFGMVPQPRLRPEQAERLTRNLTEAWELITTDYPGYAATVRTCLRSIVPLAEPPGGGSISASARRAFGAIAISEQPDAAALALLLIHELQHVKYNAVVDLVDLVDPTHTRLYEAPWRADPRPASAVLTGAYAHTGVADYWRVRRHRTDGNEAGLARFEAAYWVAQTGRSLETLATSGALTGAGTRFVDSLRATVETLPGTTPDPGLVDGVDELSIAVSVDWRLRNHQIAESELDGLVEAWRVGAAPPAVSAAVAYPGTPPGPAIAAGLAGSLRRGLLGITVDHVADQPEQAYLRGDHEEAAHAFAARVASDDDRAAWAGLALAWRRCGRAAAARSVRDRPELVRAFHRRLGGGTDLEAVATWLAGPLRSAAGRCRS